MNFPSTPLANVTVVEYEIHVTGEQGGTVSGLDALALHRSWNDQDLLPNAAQLAAFEEYAQALAAIVESNKPTGSTVTLKKYYAGNAYTDRETVTF